MLILANVAYDLGYVLGFAAALAVLAVGGIALVWGGVLGLRWLFRRG